MKKNKTYIIPTPLALLQAKLPPVTKLVWCSIMSFQGSKEWCWPSNTAIGKRLMNQYGKPTDEATISRAKKALIKSGFLVKKGRRLSCQFLGNCEEELTSDQEVLTENDEHKLISRQSKLISDQSEIDLTSSEIDLTSIPTENKTNKRIQEKGTIKTKNKREAENAVEVWQEIFPDEPLIQPVHQELLNLRCPDLKILRFTLEDWKALNYRAHNIPNIVTRYQKLSEEFDFTGDVPKPLSKDGRHKKSSSRRNSKSGNSGGRDSFGTGELSKRLLGKRRRGDGQATEDLHEHSEPVEHSASVQAGGAGQ